MFRECGAAAAASRLASSTSTVFEFVYVSNVRDVPPPVVLHHIITAFHVVSFFARLFSFRSLTDCLAKEIAHVSQPCPKFVLSVSLWVVCVLVLVNALLDGWSFRLLPPYCDHFHGQLEPFSMRARACVCPVCVPFFSHHLLQACLLSLSLAIFACMFASSASFFLFSFFFFFFCFFFYLFYLFFFYFFFFSSSSLSSSFSSYVLVCLKCKRSETS